VVILLPPKWPAPGPLSPQETKQPYATALKSSSITATRPAEARAEISALPTAHLPHLEPSDTSLIDLACDVISDLQQIRQYLDSRGGIINRKGQPQGCAGLYRSLMPQAESGSPGGIRTRDSRLERPVS
jgi:hypothetical protein